MLGLYLFYSIEYTKLSELGFGSMRQKLCLREQISESAVLIICTIEPHQFEYLALSAFEYISENRNSLWSFIMDSQEILEWVQEHHASIFFWGGRHWQSWLCWCPWWDWEQKKEKIYLFNFMYTFLYTPCQKFGIITIVLMFLKEVML